MKEQKLLSLYHYTGFLLIWINLLSLQKALILNLLKMPAKALVLQIKANTAVTITVWAAQASSHLNHLAAMVMAVLYLLMMIVKQKCLQTLETMDRLQDININILV